MGEVNHCVVHHADARIALKDPSRCRDPTLDDAGDVGAAPMAAIGAAEAPIAAIADFAPPPPPAALPGQEGSPPVRRRLRSKVSPAVASGLAAAAPRHDQHGGGRAHAPPSSSSVVSADLPAPEAPPRAYQPEVPEAPAPPAPAARRRQRAPIEVRCCMRQLGLCRGIMTYRNNKWVPSVRWALMIEEEAVDGQKTCEVLIHCFRYRSTMYAAQARLGSSGTWSGV